MVFLRKNSNAKLDWLYPKKVNGQVKLKVFKGNVIILGRKSDDSLYDNSLVSFDEVGDYNQKDAEGFIKVNSVRLKKSNL